MIDYVVDTHALFWFVSNSSRLGTAALAALKDASLGHARVHIHVIVLAEIHYLNVKLGSLLDIPATVQRIRANPSYVLHPFTIEQVLDFSIDAQVPEMHDRMIVGLTRRLGAQLITRDRAITQAATVPIVW